MKIEVVCENSDFLVINKPPGVVVNRARTAREETIQDWAEKYLKISKGRAGDTFIARAGIVHRLDKDTSGLLVIAKNEQTFKNLQTQFKKRSIVKKYLVLVHGRVKPGEGRIELPISRSPFDREKFGVFPGGREAVTGYKTLFNFQLSSRVFNSSLYQRAQIKGFSTFDFSLLEVFPKTGRTHQVRVHLKYIGYPIVADTKYAGRKTSHADRNWCPRMFFHAHFLAFSHPRSRGWVEFKVELPDDLKLVLDKLKKE